MPQADDTAVKDEVVAQDATVAAPAAPEPKDTEVAEDDLMEASLEELDPDIDKEEETDSKASSESQADDPTEETEPETQPQGEQKVAPKSENRYRQLANENRELKERLTRLKTQETQVASEQELLNEVNPETGEYYTVQEAERIARQQTLEQTAQSAAQERYVLEVQQNQDTIRSEAQKALTEFPMFDSDNPAYNPTLSAQADQLLGQSLIIDNGVLVGSTLSPYQIYKTIADATQANSAKARADAQRSVEKMTANVDTTGGSSQATKTKVDPDLEAFDTEANSR